MIEITYISLISIDDERYKYLYDKRPHNMNSLCIIKKKKHIFIHHLTLKNLTEIIFFY